jgi:hypothetical protein
LRPNRGELELVVRDADAVRNPEQDVSLECN